MFNNKLKEKLEKLQKEVEANDLSMRLREAGFVKLGVYRQSAIESVRYIGIDTARELLDLHREGLIKP